MERQDEARCVTEAPRPSGIREAGMESAKLIPGRRSKEMDIGERKTYLESSPEKSVVLSPRLEELIREVGGCQTEQLAALVRRVMYEFLSR